MIKNFLCGIGVGVANIIPGISGGTILVILGLFDKLMEAVSTIFSKKKWKDKVPAIIFMIQVIIGVLVGLVVFAKVLTFLFKEFELQTISAFAGFILLSLPILKKEEMKHDKFNFLFLVLGILFIAILVILNPTDNEVTIALEDLLNKTLNFPYLMLLLLLGIIGGATMIFPGVSGSMVLLVLGWYHLFKGYVAYVTTFNIKILIPLCFIGLGVVLGIVLSAKLTNFLLKKYKVNTMSFIFGLIIMSTIIIFPMNKELYTVSNIITSIITFILGGLFVTELDKLKYKKRDKFQK